MSGVPLQVLIIEDSASDLLLLRESFREVPGPGCELIAKTRLEEGIEFMQSNPVDLVMLDLGLPDSKGLDTFSRLHEAHPKIPVVVLTALDDESVGVAAVRMGAQDYMVKGQVEPNILRHSIAYAIERQRITDELVESRERLSKLAARVQAVREEERTRLSRTVHDELGQMITALKMDMNWVKRRIGEEGEFDPKQVIEKLAEAENVADQAIESIQKIAIELRPAALDNLGLGEAIRDEARRFERRTEVVFELSLSRDFPTLPPLVATALFRIFQELLTNIARHAGASTVEVTLFAEDGMAVLDVADDGKGIPEGVHTRKTSLGLLGMTERAAALGGQISFESAPGHGTRARVGIPLEWDESDEDSHSG